MNFFEGSEKKFEIVVGSSAGDLRARSQSYWEGVVRRAEARILSKISNAYCDAYLLSESSLFVWSDRILMITCGKTRLVDALMAVISDLGVEEIASLIYQRKNEYFAHLQETTFAEDARRIMAIAPSRLYRFGELDGHHVHFLHLDSAYAPASNDQTTEILTYHIKGSVADRLLEGGHSLSEARALINVDRLQSTGLAIDDFVFDPCGYSMNGLKDDRYVTLHVTPQAETSYVSFETNFDLTENTRLVRWLFETFRPQSADILRFNAGSVALSEDMKLVSHCSAENVAGYFVDFAHYAKRPAAPEAPKRLQEGDLI